MKYEARFTDRVVMKDDSIGSGLSYVAKIHEEDIVIRLGLYEDIGFSPCELAELLLDSEILNSEEMERVKIAKMRAESYDENNHYFFNFS